MEEQYKGVLLAADKLLSIAYRLRSVLGNTNVVNELFTIRMEILDEIEKLK